MAHRRGKKPPPAKPPTGYCETCNKIVYYKHADAKKAATQQGPRQRVYRCPENEDHFHRATWQDEGRVTFYRQRIAGDSDAHALAAELAPEEDEDGQVAEA